MYNVITYQIYELAIKANNSNSKTPNLFLLSRQSYFQTVIF